MHSRRDVLKLGAALVSVLLPFSLPVARRPSPTPVARPGLVYDVARRRTVLFGGSDNNGAVGETWEWDGSLWNHLAVPGPRHRFSHAMVYDSARRKCVVFGGVDGYDGNLLGDTWQYDGRAWTLAANAGPSPRIAHAMAFDSRRGVTVLYAGGGASSDSPTQRDTWEWNGTTWTEKRIPGPSPATFHKMEFDDRRGVVVLFGGRGGGDETWEYDGSDWTRKGTTGPRPRDHHATAYDSNRGRVVVFGGGWQGPEDTPEAEIWLNDLWEWDGSTWAKVAG